MLMGGNIVENGKKVQLMDLERWPMINLQNIKDALLMELDKEKENIILEMEDNGKENGITICNMEMANIQIKMGQ